MKAKKFVLMSILVTISLIVSLLENYVPIPIPGVKLGISNIVIINALLILNLKETYMIAFVKSFILMILVASPLSFFYSFLGAASSIAIMYFANKYLSNIFSLIGVSVLGSIFHITTQLVVASVILNTFIVFNYLPIIGIFSVITGALVGFVSIKLYKILRGVYVNEL